MVGSSADIYRPPREWKGNRARHGENEDRRYHTRGGPAFKGSESPGRARWREMITIYYVLR